jgi:1-acyl-sn-glycerol-3-phosphate acyltransferase
MKVIQISRLAGRAAAALGGTLAIHWLGVRARQIFTGRYYPDAIGLWGRCLARIMGIRIHRLNERTGPRGGMIVANHMGFLDVPALLSHFPALFVIKMEMRRVFYFGKALARQGHVFVERGDRDSRRSAAQGLRRRLEQGYPVIVFPEGRSSPGAERLPFKVGSFAAAKEAGVPVEGCVIDYLPDRRMLEWDVERKTLPQLAELFARRRTDISVEFVPAREVEGDPARAAQEWHDLFQRKLEQYDRRRESRAAGEDGHCGGVAR